MKHLLIAISLLFTASCATYEDSHIKSVANTYIKRVYSINGNNLCSSVFIEYKGKIRHVTNNHCCENRDVFYMGKNTTQVKKNPNYDLCELSHDQMPKRGIQFADKIHEQGDRIFVIGFPMYHELSISTGRITSDEKIDIVPGLPVVMTNAFVFYGNSGGAVINTDGKLLGITAITIPQVWTGGFISMKRVIEFLEEK